MQGVVAEVALLKGPGRLLQLQGGTPGCRRWGWECQAAGAGVADPPAPEGPPGPSGM